MAGSGAVVERSELGDGWHQHGEDAPHQHGQPILIPHTHGSRADRPGDSQALPTANDEQDVQSQVVADITKRRQLGIDRYGTPLQPFNGRDALLDLYEELLDAVMYVKQRLVEEDRIVTIRVVFDGPPGPVGGRFVEVETPTGEGVRVGKWVDGGGGRWALELEARVPRS